MLHHSPSNCYNFPFAMRLTVDRASLFALSDQQSLPAIGSSCAAVTCSVSMTDGFPWKSMSMFDFRNLIVSG